MNLTTTDIENLNKVIYGLSDLKCETVPELLDGWQKFPSHDDPKDNTYRFYESFLVDQSICAIKDGWTPNSVISGFKTLQLHTEGYNLIHHKKSIQDFIEDKEQKHDAQPTINIIGDKNVVGQGNFIADKIHQSKLDIRPIIKPNRANTQQQTESVRSSSSVLTRIWSVISNNPLISAIIAGLIVSIIAFLLKWN